MDDPLLALYESEPYRGFFLQRRHPFSYSRASIARVMEANGFKVIETIPHQRCARANRLMWLQRREPGGNAEWQEAFSGVDGVYRPRLGAAGKTDAVIVVAEPRQFAASPAGGTRRVPFKGQAPGGASHGYHQ